MQLPGHVLSKESDQKLVSISRLYPVVFSNRTLYLAVHQLLSEYFYKLPLRRKILGLFTSAAKSKPSPDA